MSDSGRASSGDSNRQLVARALTGVARNALKHRPALRYQFAREVWSATKRFGAEIETIELRELPAVSDCVIEGYIDDHNRPVLAALCRVAGAGTFFEIGTNRGRTAWTVARNNPGISVLTLDLPSPDAEVSLSLNASDKAFLGSEWASGEAFHETPEAARIVALKGDSATFDFSPWEGSIDVVLVDGAHSHDYVRNDTEVALRLLSPTGTIVWDDYPAIPGVYRVLNDRAREFDRPLFHVLGTRLVIYSRQQLVERLADYGHRGVA